MIFNKNSNFLDNNNQLKLIIHTNNKNVVHEIPILLYNKDKYCIITLAGRNSIETEYKTIK